MKIGGDPDHPVTQGFLCYRTNHFLDRQYSPDRLTTPLMRRTLDEELRPVSWDEALGLRRRATDSPFAPNRGPRRSSTTAAAARWALLKTPLRLLLRAARADHPEARRHLLRRRRLGAGGRLRRRGQPRPLRPPALEPHPPLGEERLRLEPAPIPVLRDASARGAELVLIDPVHHAPRALREAFVQPRPGGDLALAWPSRRSSSRAAGSTRRRGRATATISTPSARWPRGAPAREPVRRGRRQRRRRRWISRGGCRRSRAPSSSAGAWGGA